MKAHVSPLYALLLAGCALHQPGGRGPDSIPISETSVRSHMEFLASDALAGRGSGTRDEWIAATYIASHMRRIGLEPAGDDGGFVQAVTIERGQAASPPVLSFAGERFTHGEEMLVLSMSAPPLSGPLHKPTAARGELPNGAVVLLPPDASNAAAPPPTAQGAAVLLLVETPQVRSRWAESASRLPSLPAQISGVPPRASARPTTIVLAKEAYEKIATLANGTSITFDVELKPAQTTRTWNVVGRLTGYERSTLGPTLAKHGARLVKDPHPDQNFFMRSDNYQFARRGVIKHTVSSYGLHKDYHQPSDEVETIDFAHMTGAIASMPEPIRWLANSDFKPEWMPGMKP